MSVDQRAKQYCCLKTTTDTTGTALNLIPSIVTSRSTAVKWDTRDRETSRAEDTIYVRSQRLRPQGVGKENSGDAASQCGNNEYISVAETSESKGA